MKKACVIIPIYKIDTGTYEQISMDQCFKILHNYDIWFVLPEHLEEQVQTIKYIKDKKAKYKTFDSKFFKNISGYNRLIKYPGFYGSFLEYEFMLIHQLDAFVFKDDLDYWCNRNYDNLGAPLFEQHDYAKKDSPIVGQGNGGFCLRNVRNCYQIVNQYKKLKYTRTFTDVNRPFFINLFRFIKHQLIFIYSGYPFQPIINEDLFWAEVIPENFSNFKVASSQVSMAFSFEVNPDVLYRMNGNELPFGCHAWWRYDLNFWRKHIEAYGYEL